MGGIGELEILYSNAIQSVQGNNAATNTQASSITIDTTASPVVYITKIVYNVGASKIDKLNVEDNLGN